MTTTVSSSVTAVVSSQDAERRLTLARHDGDVAASYKPFHLQENPGAQLQNQPRNHRVADSKGLAPATSQENSEPKVLLLRETKNFSRANAQKEIRELFSSALNYLKN